jgi:hypothetical protein
VETPTDRLQPDRDAVALALNTARTALQDALSALQRARAIDPRK